MVAVTQFWGYTGAAQSFVVPAGVTTVRFHCWGALGGIPGDPGNYQSDYDFHTAGGLSGPAGYTAGDITVTPGDTYNLYVGGVGAGGTALVTKGKAPGGKGGWNGGGAGGNGYGSNNNIEDGFGGAGGGGASDIRYTGTALANRIMVAAGSGGATYNLGYQAAWSYAGSSGYVNNTNNQSPTPPYGNGDTSGVFSTTDPNYTISTVYLTGSGNGGIGGPSGGNGGSGSNSSGGAYGASQGKGATTSAGGAGGTQAGGSPVSGAAGAWGQGGAGANCTSSQATVNNATCGGGGGGGGYYGGGGGANGYTVDQYASAWGNGGAGGGGSNYINTFYFSNTLNYGHVFKPYVAKVLGYDNGGGGLIRADFHLPATVSITSLSENETIPRDQITAVQFSWAFVGALKAIDPASKVQSANIRYSVQGAGVWTQSTINNLLGTSQTTFNIPANTFTAGQIYTIQVQVVDTDGDLSPWASVDVLAIQPPAAPTITAPAAGSTSNTASVPVAWTIPTGTELLYRVRGVGDQGAVFDSGPLNASTRINLCPTTFTVASAPLGSTTGQGNGGTAPTLSIVTSPTPEFGASALKVAWPTSSSEGYVQIPFTTQIGVTYDASLYVTANSTDPAVQILALDTTGAIIGGGGTSGAFTLGTWQRLDVSFTATTTTTYIAVQVQSTTTSGQVCYINAVLAEINYTNAPLLFFDGSYHDSSLTTGHTFAWSGTSGNSTSTMTGSNTLSYTMHWAAGSQNVSLLVSYATTASLGVFSAETARSFAININPPAVPVVSLAADDDAGTVTLTMRDGGGANLATYFYVYRTDLTHGGDEVFLSSVNGNAGGTNVEYVDYTVTTGVLYAYRIRAFSATGGYADAT